MEPERYSQVRETILAEQPHRGILVDSMETYPVACARKRKRGSRW